MQIRDIVAANVRAARQKKQLSLDAASRLTGVSRSMLGQIERGEVNPTVSVLDRLATGYQIPLVQFLEAPPEPLTVIRNQSLTRERSGNGSAFRYTIAQQTAASLRLERLEILPGGSLETAPDPGCAALYLTVYRGAASIQAAGETTELNRWDTLCITVPGAILIRNSSDQVLQLHITAAFD